MHFTRPYIHIRTLRNLFKNFSSFPTHVPVVKVFSTKEDEFLRVSFQYVTRQILSLKFPKDESVQSALLRIKNLAELQRKKEELRQTFASQSSLPIYETISEFDRDEINVHLIQNDSLLADDIPNSDAWIQASNLKIGKTLYEVKYNAPTVTILSLPDFIVSGCTIRPHFILECACFEDSTFVWYRSITEDEAKRAGEQGGDIEVHCENDMHWLKVNEGFSYTSSAEDIGCFLKIACTPGLKDMKGPVFTAQSKAVVESPPDRFPFQDRQRNINSFTDNDSIRCVSYNVLANQYVERKKFPYASAKARDVYYRKQILLKELQGYKSDIICLQEVQERVFEYDLLPVLSQLGYIGFYNRKGGHRYEGLATFFRTSKFKVTRNYGVLLNKKIKEKNIFMDLLSKVAGNYKDMSKLLAQDTALQVFLLENAYAPEKKLIVANTHLYSNKDTPEVRLIQAAVCINFIEYVLNRKGLQSEPLLFCGDFNSLPNSSTFDFITSGAYECCPSWKNNTDEKTDAVLSHNLCLDTACGIPEYTNYTHEFHGCLDYIFYSKNALKVTDVIPMPKHEDVIAHEGLPNEYFPSDHIALVCTLQSNKS